MRPSASSTTRSASASGFVDVVGHEQDGWVVALPQVKDELMHRQARERVERTERLVQQHQFRFADERTRERDPLSLASGERQRPGIEMAGQTDLAERFLRDLQTALASQSERHVLTHALPEQQA